jgi:hypothetical protein
VRRRPKVRPFPAWADRRPARAMRPQTHSPPPCSVRGRSLPAQ